MIKLNWEGAANGQQDVYILIAQRVSSLRLIGRIHLVRKLVNDKEAGLTFNLHIQDSTLRDPFWFISDVYGYREYDKVKLCRVKFSTEQWWAIKLPKGSFTGMEEVFFDGGVANPDYLRWIVKDPGWIVVVDCKSWSSSLSLSSDPSVVSFTEKDPVFKAHPSYTITQTQIDEFHEPVTLNPDLVNGLELSEQNLGLNLATTDKAGAMSAEDKVKLDSIDADAEYYPLNENPAGYLTEETDPLFKLSAAYQIKASDITRWNDAYYWGNHADFGYLTSFVETDPIFRSSPAYTINYGQIVAWNESSSRTPVHRSYASITVMLADQDDQVANFIYYTVSTDEYWEYLGGRNSLITDYRKISKSGSIDWVEINNNITAQIGYGYITTNDSTRVNITLPVSNLRKSIRVAGKGNAGWKVIVPSGIIVKFIYEDITSFIQSTDKYDAIELVCVAANTYHVVSSIGNLNYDIEL